VWNFPDPVPVHREPLYSPRPDLVAKYPTYDDVKVFWRVPTLYKTLQQQNVKDGIAEKFPLILTSGRIVEYEGGGDESRANPWLAELQQECYVEINPKPAADRNIRQGEYIWLLTPTGARLRIKAFITPRVGSDTVFVPYSFGGWWQGVDVASSYPTGAVPWVRGEAINTGTTYGYDRVTMMQETKTTLCQVARA
jgi:formate dehydrogenase major subunit